MKKILFSIVLFSLSISGQSPYKEVYQKSFFKGKYPQKIPVLMRTYPVYIGNGLFRVYLPVQIKYNFFQFLYKKDIYSAAAEIEVSIENSESK
ncbi:MAG: hypothetical protein GWN16_00380, partial [Calditrichae bacterium]|nr:hypothetical protein [Calditrichia bacterium]